MTKEEMIKLEKICKDEPMTHEEMIWLLKATLRAIMENPKSDKKLGEDVRFNFLTYGQIKYGTQILNLKKNKK